ncbi:hypothetical protein PENTCL1PPCAC_13666, partial [Pristionchus entomophagus]
GSSMLITEPMSVNLPSFKNEFAPSHTEDHDSTAAGVAVSTPPDAPHLRTNAVVFVPGRVSHPSRTPVPENR